MAKGYSVTIVVMDDEGIMGVLELQDLGGRRGSVCEASWRPDVNVKEAANMLRKVAEGQETNYYMSRVRSLSREAREAIEKAVKDDDIPPASPF